MAKLEQVISGDFYEVLGKIEYNGSVVKTKI